MIIGLLSFSILKSVFIIHIEKTGGFFLLRFKVFLEQNWVYSFENYFSKVIVSHSICVYVNFPFFFCKQFVFLVFSTGKN